MDKGSTTGTIVRKDEKRESKEISVFCTRFIAYFDVFDFPLTKDELIDFFGNEFSGNDLEMELNKLIGSDRIEFNDGFYHLTGRKIIIQRRKENESRAKKFISKVPVWVRLIARFPFVRSVCVSGSLSKGTMNQKGDVDFFIITEPGRLWICRTFLILFKKIFLFNSKKYFCVNYFLDTNNLEVPDQNMFTATEIVFLLPVAGEKYYSEFMKANVWVKQFYPSFSRKNTLPVFNGNPFIRSAAEVLLDNRSGDILDDYFMKLTLRRWKKKFPHFNAVDFEVAMRTRKNVSKHHPNHFQEKVISKFLSNLKENEIDLRLSKIK